MKAEQMVRALAEIDGFDLSTTRYRFRYRLGPEYGEVTSSGHTSEQGAIDERAKVIAEGFEAQGVRSYEIAVEPPRYLSDLNAIHRLVSRLTSAQAEAYVSELARMVGATVLHTPAFHVAYVNATAAQRAEAILKACGRWTEKPGAESAPAAAAAGSGEPRPESARQAGG